MKTIDPRIAERREEVTEDRARHRLRLVLRIVVITLVVAAVVWAFRSPILSIREVSVSGEMNSDPQAIAAAVGADIGQPTISIRTGNVRDALLEDPWIAAVHVSVSWPGSLEIDVVEREPVATAESSRGFVLIADDGVIVDATSDRPELPTLAIELPRTIVPGTRLDDALLLGAVEFAADLPSDASNVVITTRDGELWAKVLDHDVRLGRAVEMGAKAAALEALLENGVTPGAFIDLLSPRRPAVARPVGPPLPAPRVQLEGEGEVDAEVQASG